MGHSHDFDGTSIGWVYWQTKQLTLIDGDGRNQLVTANYAKFQIP
jgi:hypothetical protein